MTRFNSSNEGSFVWHGRTHDRQTAPDVTNDAGLYARIKMRVTKPFALDGRDVQPGEVVNVPMCLVKDLEIRGRAERVNP